MPLLFRIAGLLVALVTGAIGIADVAARGPSGLAILVPNLPPDRRLAGFSALMILFVAALLAFCALFWRATRGHSNVNSEWRLRLILVTQLATGLLIPDLMIIVACEAGYLLTTRTRTRWIYVQLAFLMAVILIGFTQGGLSPAPELVHVPRRPAIVLTIAQAFAWQLLSFAAGYMAGREGDARRELSLALGELRATQQVLSDSVRINERLNIARELHDTIGHHLAALSLKLQLAARTAEGPARKPVEDAHLIAKLLLSDVRAAVSDMRHEGAVDLAKALRSIAEGIDQPRIGLEMADAGMIHDPAKAQALLRCAQEAITNSIRHSQAQSIHLRLASTDSGVDLEIRDNGRGTPELRQGNGLRGMRERVEAMGGTLEIDTAPGRGFRLLAHVPLTGAA